MAEIEEEAWYESYRVETTDSRYFNRKWRIVLGGTVIMSTETLSDIQAVIAKIAEENKVMRDRKIGGGFMFRAIREIGPGRC